MIGDSWFSLDNMKTKKHLEKVLNAQISREEENENNRWNSELIMPIHSMDGVTASWFPNNIPDDVKDKIISNARRLVDNSLARKAFNTSEYEVSRDQTSKVLTLNFNKRGIIGWKSSECLHYTMFQLCSHSVAVAAFTNTLDKLLSESFKKAKPVSYTDTTKHGYPTGSGTKQGYRRKRKSNKRKETSNKQENSQKTVSLEQSLGPKPAQPEPQIQPYKTVQRSEQLKKCNDCEELFDKNNEKLLILGRNEFDWYISVDGKNNTKVYTVTQRNFYDCVKRRYILSRRPLHDVKSIDIKTDLELSYDEQDAIENELGVNL